MNIKQHITTLIMLITGILFFGAYFLKDNTTYFVLGCAWICIAAMDWKKNRNHNDKE
ncbi:hypothetical protein AALA24_11920 [Anaerovoracaceae bacterium 42-11]|nr:hypothetical protein [Emergencia sp.]